MSRRATQRQRGFSLVEVLLAIFQSLDDACDSVSDVIAERLEPSALEILDKLTIEAIEDSVFAAGYPRAAAAVLLIEVEGVEAEVAGTAAAMITSKYEMPMNSAMMKAAAPMIGGMS